MGLDNGVCFRFCSKDENKNQEAIDKLNSLFKTNRHKFAVPHIYSDGTIETAYWRKFWGLRGEFIYVLQDCPNRWGDDADESTFNVDLDHIDDLIGIAKIFLNPQIFNERGMQQIWEYDEYKDVMLHEIDCLEKTKKMLEWLEENNYEDFEDYQCYFYDSY